MNIKKYIMFLLIIFILSIGFTTVSASGMISHSYHNYTEYQSSSWKKVSTSGTCRKKYETYKCSGCSKTEDRLVETDYSHNWGSWGTTKTPTCSAKGEEERGCKDCDYDEDRELAIDPDNHNPFYEYQNSTQCRRKCSWCEEYLQVANNHTYDGDSTGLHYCIFCKTQANGTNGWPKYHYYPSGLLCDFCNKGGLAISKTNFSSLPSMNDYYMIGSGKNWEKSLKNIEITYNYTPYSNAANTSYIDGVYVNLVSFVHGNWAFHAGQWSEGDSEDTTITQWPKANITKPLKSWEGPTGNWSQSGNNKITLTHSSGKTYKSGSLPNGHWQVWNTYANNMIMSTDMRMFLNGSCNGHKPNEIPGFIAVGYRDTNGNKITGAPSDTRAKVTVWTDKNLKPSYTATANHTKLDSLGWRYKGYKIYKSYNIPSSVSNGTLKSGAKATVKPTLGDQTYSIVFIYEPIKVIVTHRNESDSSKIDSPKNKTYLLPDIIQGDESVTSFSKTLFPAYILKRVDVKRSKKTVSTKYSTNEADRGNIDLYTTRLPELGDTEEVKKKIDQKVIAVKSQSPIKGTVGSGADITINFYYATLKLTVSHHNMDGSLIKDEKGKTELKYSINLNGHKINEPSLTVDGERHKLSKKINKKDVYYKYDGIIRKVEIYKEDNLLATLGNDIIGYESSWIYSTNNVSNAKLKDVAREIAKMESNITIKFYYQQIPLLTVKHIEDTNGLPLKRADKILMTSGDVIITPADFSGDGYENISFINEEQKTINKEDYPSSIIVTNTGASKTVTFVYKYKDSIIPSPDNPEDNNGEKEKLVLRSNTKGDEEYDVEAAIPTSEDLYTEVIANGFDLKKNIQESEKSCKIVFNLYTKYFDEIADEITVDDVKKQEIGSITINDFKYKYWSADGTVLKKINKAIVKNEVIYKNGEVEVLPSDDYKNGLPYFVYEVGGVLKFNESNISSNLYEAKPGFYNAKNKNGVITVDVLLDEDRYDKLNKTQKNELLLKYKNDYNLLLDLARNDVNTKVTSDKLSVKYNGEEFKIMSGVPTQLGKEYTVKELMDLGIAYINSEPNITVNEGDLYKDSGIYVKKNISNDTSGKYKTTADIYYDGYSMIHNSQVVNPNDVGITVEESVRTLNGNSVKVHTPVVNEAELLLKENKDYKQIDSTKDVIVLGETFTIKIPHAGDHNNIKGYGDDKNYNYNGLNANKNNKGVNYDKGLFESKKESFAGKKLIKFEFGILFSGINLNKKYVRNTNNGIYELINISDARNGFSISDSDKESIYIPANTWFELPLDKEEYDFVIPTWEAEKWNGKTVKIYTKVVAENISDDLLKTETDGNLNNDENANKNVSANEKAKYYIAKKTFEVKIIGKMYDIQIRATNDTGYANFINDNALTAAKFPLGEAGTNKVGAYKYGLKLGAKVFFDLKTYGLKVDTNVDTSDYIKVIPKYYYVSKNGDSLQEVDLYYHTNTQRYVKMAGTNVIKFNTKMTQNNGAKYFANYNTNLGLTSKILGGTFNYATEFIYIGDSSLIKLVNRTRIVAYPKSSDLIKAVFEKDKLTFIPDSAGTVPTENQIINSVGRWYGEFRIPSSTVVAKAGTDPKVATNVLKNGYIIVAFDDLQTVNGSTKYLSYEKPSGNTQWSKELYNTKITLPNGKDFTFDKAGYAMAIYETDIKLNNDFETVGTH